VSAVVPVPPSPARAWWEQRSAVAKVLVVLVGAILAANVVVALVNLVAGGQQPGGPSSSAYSTGSQGFAAWSQLLARRGHRVVKVRGPLADANLPPGATLVLADPESLGADEARRVSSVLAGGGRVVLLGGDAVPLATLAGGQVAWQPGGSPVARVLAPSPETAGLARVVGAGNGHLRDPAYLLPVLGTGPRDVLAAVTSVPAFGGRPAGRLVVVADAGIFDNATLDRADNAAFSLQVVGSGHTVYFAEGVHGFGQSSGLSAIPVSWRWAFGGLLLALLAGMWSVGRRFGPPEDESRQLAPLRGDYVDALGASLARTGRPDEAAAPLLAATRRSLRERTGSSATVDDRHLVDLAVATGVDPRAASTALHVPTTDAELISVAQASAQARAGGTVTLSPTDPDPGGPTS
jgi:hypothetical protein